MKKDSGDEVSVVLVVGSCGLDRLLSVPSYPSADSKVLTSAYYESGGGNAANTAAAMARLSGCSFARVRRDAAAECTGASKNCQRIRVKLLTKLGQDAIGKSLVEELRNEGVDLSSPLFMLGPVGSTSPVTTIVVSADDNTRTCLHTPGTCGQLTDEDVQSVDLEEVFRNVVLLHSDTRHTDAAVLLAREAKIRGIPISIDAERYRGKNMEELIKASSLFFVNESQIVNYLNAERCVDFSSSPTVLPDFSCSAFEGKELDCYTRSATLCYSLNGREGQGIKPKEVIVTRGEIGALHITVECRVSNVFDGRSCRCSNIKHEMLVINEKQMSAEENLVATDSLTIRQSVWRPRECEESDQTKEFIKDETTYALIGVGVLRDCSVIDTTGAGDAFIAGYLMAWLVGNLHSNGPSHPCDTCSLHHDENHCTRFCLNFAAWVAGKKLSGHGARDAVPDAKVVDEKGEDTLSLFQFLKGVIQSPR